MSHNPYTPPTSHVEDPSVASADPDGKRDVLRATWALWASFGVGVLGFMLQIFEPLAPNMSMTITLIALTFAAALGLLITWWITSKLKAGRNWMRILLTVLMVLGILGPLLMWDFYKAALVTAYATNPIKAVVDLGQYALGLVAVALLYTPRSRSWFAAMKAAG